MIGKVKRGDDIGGLMAYLFGPGKHNEHTDPHVIGHWTGLPGEVVGLGADGQPDLGPAVADLKRDLKTAGLLGKADTVWHCSVAIPAGDGLLTDAQWRAVAETIVEEVGLEDPDAGAVRWVAVRHGLSKEGNDHIHIAATLAGRTRFGDLADRTFLRADYAAVRRVCNQFEARWGMTGTGAGTGAAHQEPTRAEVEIAARTGLELPTRLRLERAVRTAAIATTGPAEFTARLAGEGITVTFTRPSAQRPGTWLGVTFAAADYTDAAGVPVAFSGRKLARDLSAPGIQARWDARNGADPRLLGGSAGQLVTALADALRAADVPGGGLPELRGRIAAGADALWAAAEAVEEDRGGPWHTAAAEAGRAAREPGQVDARAAAGITGLLDGLAALPRGTTKAEAELARAYAMFTRLLRLWAKADTGEPARVAGLTATRITATTTPPSTGSAGHAARPAGPRPSTGRTATQDPTTRRSHGA